MTSSPRQVVLALADAMFEPVERPDRLEALAGDVLAFAAQASVMSRISLRVALVLLQLSPLLLLVSLWPLERLDRAARQRVLARIERTPLGLAFVAWRTLLVLHYYEDARELAGIGYREQRTRHLVVLPAAAESGVRLRGDHAADDSDEAAEVDAKEGAA